jgi:hypothetical protein
MTDDKDITPSFGNFGIQDTMEMGMGNAELLNDLLSPESSTGDPDKITKVGEEEPEKKPAPAKKVAPVAKKEEEEKEDTSKVIKDFLTGADEDEEEEDEPAAPKAQKEGSEEEEEEETEQSRFTALSNDLFKLGVFSKEDEEEVDISTPEQFLERFNLEKKKGAIEVVENFIGQFGDDYKNAFEAIFVKGVNPKDYFSTYNKITNFAELDLGKEENQVSVIRQALLDQGFEQEDVDSEIERFRNYGDLESVAQKHHKVLIKKEAANLAKLEEENQAKLQRKSAEKQQYVQNVQQVLQDKLKNKEFDGIPINPTLAGELQDFLLVDKYKTESGELLTDFDRAILELKRPENHPMKVKVALLLKTLEKDPNLTTLQRAAISKKTDSLFSEVARHTSKSSKSGSKTSGKSASWWQ